MNRKNAFTLIELLAVIVILAIILGIAVPVIGSLIGSSRENSFTSQKKLIERAARLYYETKAPNLLWEGNVSYVTVGELKTNDYLEEVTNPLNEQVIEDETKILIFKNAQGRLSYSLQLYDDIVMDWYRDRMIEAYKQNNYDLPVEIGQTKIINLNELMATNSVDELRLPLDITDRCAGYVEVEKISTDEYEYNAYVDCLTNASTFASHYVSYGGKYLDNFRDVIETNDGGFLAVGESNSEVITKYGNEGKGKYDAIIVKFNASGDVEWSQNFGGSNNDYYYKVVETTDSYIAVGQTTSSDGDLTGIYKGGSSDALIVKYNKLGSVINKRSYGSSEVTGASNGGEVFSDIIKTTDGFVVVGGVNGTAKDGDLQGESVIRATEAAIMKIDNNLNTIWQKFLVASYTELFNSVIETAEGDFVVVGYSSSNNYDMTDIGYLTPSYQNEAIILKYDSQGQIKLKNSFRGTFTDIFYDIVETTDGYVAVGQSSSSDYDMTGVSKAANGEADALIVKYDKNLSDVTWKKSFGGTGTDVFNGLTITSDNQILAVGYSKSEDMDMSNIIISQDGYSNAISIKYDKGNGNILSKKVFGGTNSDVFNSVIENNDNHFIMAGKTFSYDYHLKNFNKGHSDAILVDYDNSFNLMKRFDEPVVIIDKLKQIVPNYGTTISNKYDSIFTSNNPTVHLSNWCVNIVGLDNLGNYKYGRCLVPFNSDDVKRLVNVEVLNGLKVLTGEHEYAIYRNPNNPFNWHMISLYLGGSTGWVEISNFKLKFEDGFIGSVNSSKDNGYIEPLVTVSNSITDRDLGFFPTIMDIINDGGTTGEASYPSMNILVKPKKSKLVSVIFTSSVDSKVNDGMRIEELRNFDMSITKTE